MSAQQTEDGTPLVPPNEPQLTITLPLSAWSIITAHLQVGVYNAVAAVITNIAAQACPQIEAAQRAEAVEQAKLAKSAEPAAAQTAARTH
jgi:hypothetical protein